jgi:hypothetical protein
MQTPKFSNARKTIEAAVMINPKAMAAMKSASRVEHPLGAQSP